jgi:hypothetical protein
LFSKWLCNFTYPSGEYESSIPPNSVNTWHGQTFNFNHSKRYIMNCLIFICVSLMINDTENILCTYFFTLYIFFVEASVQIFSPDFLFFGGTGVWTQDFTLARQALQFEPHLHPFLVWFFGT